MQWVPPICLRKHYPAARAHELDQLVDYLSPRFKVMKGLLKIDDIEPFPTIEIEQVTLDKLAVKKSSIQGSQMAQPGSCHIEHVRLDVNTSDARSLHSRPKRFRPPSAPPLQHFPLPEVPSHSDPFLALPRILVTDVR